ncbi:MAG: YwiC-like family protein [Acidimicrobiales bacterium]
MLLGLLVRPSGAGAAIGAAPLLEFLARTPLKLAVGDRRRRRRRLDRTVLAERVAGTELALLVVAVVAASFTGQRWWWAPLASALPLFGLELSFDVRSRGRRLVPDLAGAVGMGAVAAAIGWAAGLDAVLAVGLWVVLAARAVAAVPFARTQCAA